MNDNSDTWHGNLAVLPASSLTTWELELIVGPGPFLFEVRWSDPEIEKN